MAIYIASTQIRTQNRKKYLVNFKYTIMYNSEDLELFR